MSDEWDDESFSEPADESAGRPTDEPALGLARGTVELVSYDPRWRDAYDREVARLDPRIDEYVLGFEHVGSTSIPGLAAKPILDILALVSDLGETDALARELEELGYEERPNDEVPDRRFFARGPESRRTHYLSVTERGSECHRDQVAFRDALRADSDRRDEYESLKRALESSHRENRSAYTSAKSSFVQSVIDGASDDFDPP
ncbi:GrpB family protein [Haloferax namakaokahaiae]|uniref:GrpB family protein n=1 Tax=Haloferax namakaokahaiae TaxID=1748331 RepID=A0ABD5ZH12_9EURY